jgi:hypothetical protein
VREDLIVDPDIGIRGGVRVRVVVVFPAFHVGRCNDGNWLFNGWLFPFIHHGPIGRFAVRPDLIRSNLSSNYRFAIVFVGVLLNGVLMWQASVTRAIIRVITTSTLSRPLFFDSNGGCDCDSSNWNRRTLGLV